ncbi:MAG: hypothetical protein ACE5LC_08155 [Candidatus Aminicenantales bacterium]
METITNNSEEKPTREKTRPRKFLPLVITVIILMVFAFAVGYYLSMVRFDRKYTQIKEREEKAEVQAVKLEIIDILLRAKAEVISARIALPQGDMERSIDSINASIAVLKGAFQKAEEDIQDKIESLRLRLATVKGFIEVDTERAEKELDTMWREIESLIKRQWEE